MNRLHVVTPSQYFRCLLQNLLEFICKFSVNLAFSLKLLWNITEYNTSQMGQLYLMPKKIRKYGGHGRALLVEIKYKHILMNV